MNLGRYAHYKQSGYDWLGMVPEHWSIKPLYGSAVERTESNRGMIENNLLSLSYGRIVSKDITSNEGLLPESFETYQIVRPGDIVLRLTDLQNDKRSLRSALVEQTGIITSAYVAITSQGPSPYFLNYLLRAYDLAKVFYSMGGGLRQSMKFSDLKRLPILIPPETEQAGIVQFLNAETTKLDALVAEQQKLIDLLNEKRQTVISHTITNGCDRKVLLKDSGLDWPRQVPAHWEVLPLTRVVRRFVDYRGVTPTKTDAGVPLITASQIKDGKIDHALDPVFISEQEYASRMTRGFPARGDLVLTTEAPLGEAALIEDERVSPGQRIILMKVEADKILSSYLLAHFQSIFGQRELWTRASGSTASGIRADRLRASQVLVPPLEEQRQIIEFIRQQTVGFETIQRDVESAIKLLQERRSALISAAVTGQIDVRGLVESEAA